MMCQCRRREQRRQDGKPLHFAFAGSLTAREPSFM